MTKKRKIILISLAVTLALAVGVGGFVYAVTNGNNNHVYEHEETGGNKLLGVGEMGYYDDVLWGQYQWWDTQFIITNPNCERDLTIEWVALIDREGAFGESVIYEGPPDGPIPDTLGPHQTFQVSIAELMGLGPDIPLDKYTLEITWSGARYSGWWWWGYWRSGRPLTGWQKEKCWYVYYPDGEWGFVPGFAISEAEMELFHSRRPFSPPDWWSPK